MGLLAVLSVYAAFLGAQRARELFTSLPMGFYWFCFVIVILAGLLTFGRLVRRPFLLMMHLGPILVILASIWASPGGYLLRQRLFKCDAIPRGQMIIVEGESTNEVYGQGRFIGHLPFSVTLHDFRREFYEPGYLMVVDPAGATARVPAEQGREVLLAADGSLIRIARHLDNLQVVQEEGGPAVIDSPGEGENAALELILQSPSAPDRRFYVYADRTAEHHGPLHHWQFIYSREVRDYFSELSFTDAQGQTLQTCDLEVNHPAAYSGYSLYQSSWYMLGDRPVTVLTVVNDSGRSVVYLGYWLLAVGISGHFIVRLYRLRGGMKNGC